MNFYFTYVLLCSDGVHYIGYAEDLDQRLKDHSCGRVKTTSKRLPVQLIYYEACLSKELAQSRERYFKTGYGREFLKKRLG